LGYSRGSGFSQEERADNNGLKSLLVTRKGQCHALCPNQVRCDNYPLQRPPVDSGVTSRFNTAGPLAIDSLSVEPREPITHSASDHWIKFGAFTGEASEVWEAGTSDIRFGDARTGLLSHLSGVSFAETREWQAGSYGGVSDDNPRGAADYVVPTLMDPKQIS